MIIHDTIKCPYCGAINECDVSINRQGKEVVLNCGNPECGESIKSRYFYSTPAPCEQTPDTQ